MTYRTIKYASMNLDANFYAVIHNGHIAAYEISGADLNIKGYKRVTYSDFIALIEKTKKREGATYQIVEKIMPTEYVRNERVEIALHLDGMEEVYKTVAKKSANYSYLTKTERQWNYLPIF